MPRCVRRIGGGQDEDDSGDQPGHHADAEKNDCRNEIDEGRQRLHQVENRTQPGIEPWPVRRRDPDRHTKPHAHDAGRQHERQAFGRLLPIALVDDEEQACDQQRRHLPSPMQPPCQRRDDQRDQDGVPGLGVEIFDLGAAQVVDPAGVRRLLQQREDHVDEDLEADGHRVEHTGEIVLQPVEPGLGRVVHAQLAFAERGKSATFTGQALVTLGEPVQHRQAPPDANRRQAVARRLSGFGRWLRGRAPRTRPPRRHRHRRWSHRPASP
jgi:hypothetical protein